MRDAAPDLPDALPADVRAAAQRLRGVALATPLLRLELDAAPAEIWLKPECLQPAGCFKIRTAGNQLLKLDAAARRRGVYTASSGNLGIGMAWLARRLGMPATVLVSDDAPAAKTDILQGLGATVRRLPYRDWWQAILKRGLPDMPGTYIDADGPDAMAGNATIGAEIVDELPEVDTILCAYGGGALACGIATAAKALKPGLRVIACELETATPLTAAREVGEPVEVDYERSFVSGIGSTQVLPSMWPLARERLDASAVVSLEQVCAAIRTLLSSNHLLAEGAGAVPVAAALAGAAGAGKVVCVVSGGNLGREDLATILDGRVPAPPGIA